MGFITEIKSLNEVPQFEVEKVQVFDGNKRCIDGVYSLQRSDTNQHLGMVKDKYRPIQMNEMIDIISEASDKVGDIDHIGYTTSKGGRKVVIQSKYRDTLDVGGDKGKVPPVATETGFLIQLLDGRLSLVEVVR